MTSPQPSPRAQSRIPASTSTLLAFAAATIIIPIAISSWTPTWFAATWAIFYWTSSLAAVVIARWLPMRLVNQVWITAIGASLATVPFSVVFWGDTAEDATTLMAIVISYIAADAAHVPYMPAHDWRWGVSQPTVVTTVVLLAGGEILYAAGFLAMAISLILAGSRNFAMHVSLFKHRRAAEAAANEDVLTGLLSRRGMTKALEEMTGTTFTLAMFDANKFKLINDEWGHVAGDKALIAIATALRGRLSEEWTIGRFGGDEFIAAAKGESELPSSVNDPITAVVQSEQGPVRLTLSVAVGSTVADESAEIDQLLAFVSRSMHEDKLARPAPQAAVDNAAAGTESVEPPQPLDRSS